MPPNLKIATNIMLEVWVEMEVDEEEPPKKEGEEVRALTEVCGVEMELKEKSGARTA